MEQFVAAWSGKGNIRRAAGGTAAEAAMRAIPVGEVAQIPLSLE